MPECEICGRSYSRRDHVLRHKRTAHPSADDIRVLREKFACNVCGKAFVDNSTLKRHVRKVHNKKYKCRAPGCHQRFGKLAPLRKHICGKHHNLDYQTVQKLFLECQPGTPEHEAAWNGSSSDGSPAVSEKVAEVEEETIYKCFFPDCGVEFPTYRGLQNHWLRHLKPFKCTQCKGDSVPEFYAYKDLVAHRHEVHRVCPFCKIVPSPGSFHRHVRSHLKANKDLSEGLFYCCPEAGCEYTCMTPDLLSGHMKNEHRPQSASPQASPLSASSPRPLFALKVDDSPQQTETPPPSTAVLIEPETDENTPYAFVSPQRFRLDVSIDPDNNDDEVEDKNGSLHIASKRFRAV